ESLGIECDNPPEGTVGVAYSHFFPASGGTEPYVFSLAGGAFPTGLTLDAATGELSGTPTVAGTFNFTVQVTDASGVTTWSPQVAAEANEWQSICWSPELSLFVAVSGDGTNR